MTRFSRTSIIWFTGALLVYSVVVLVVPSVLRAMDADNPMRYFVAIKPLIPLAFALMAYAWIHRWLTQPTDAVQQRARLEAVTVSLTATILITLTLGFLETVGLPPLSMTWVPPIIIITWGVGALLAGRRYSL